MRYGPCMCGAIDCSSCGPAQGYEVVRVRLKNGRTALRNPEDVEEGDIILSDDNDPPPEIEELLP